jgi:hypothetical protein
MKIGKWARLLLVGVALLTGCKNFWQAPSSSSSDGGSSTLSSGVFYVLNQTTSQLAGYSIVSGKLTAVSSSSPYTLPAVGPWSIAVAPNGNFLYVSTTNGIYLYTIGSGGALTLKSTTPIIQDNTGYAIAIDSTSKWLLDASVNGGLYAYAVSSTDGTLTATTSQNVQLPSYTQTQQMVISPDNKNVFVTQGSGGSAVIPFTAAANVATTSPFGAVIHIALKGTSAVAVAVDPSDRAFYIGEIAVSSGTSNTGGLRVFDYSSISSGTLTELSGSPYASGGLAPYSIVPTPYSSSAGAYVYVANRTVSGSSTGNISGFALNLSGITPSSLTPLSTTASTGTTPVSLVQDSTGNYLLVVDSGGSPDLEGYTFGTSGALTSVLTSVTGTDPVGAVAVVAAP